MVLMPADRFENALELELPAWKKLRELHVGLSLRTVLKQTHAPADSLDYAPPPEGYSLVKLRTGFQVPIGKTALDMDLELSNLLNTSYRDYTNRFRYYADDPGRNFALRIKIPFETVGFGKR